MCYPVTCSDCGKTSWGGCGLHVDSVMRSVDASDRCACRPIPDSPPRRSFRSLFGR